MSMADYASNQEPVLLVCAPDGARKYVRILQTPFLIGRGAETGNHLQLLDQRLSRCCAAVVKEQEQFYIESRNPLRDRLFINGRRTENCLLNDGDVITFGVKDSYEIYFLRSPERHKGVSPD
jgi:hypothetical protein